MTILKKDLRSLTMKRAVIITFCLYFLLILANIVLEKTTLFYGWSYTIFLLLFYVIFLAFITNFKQKSVLNLLQTNLSIKTDLLLYGLVGSIAIILIGLSLQYCSAYLNPDLEIKPPQRFNIIYLVFYIIGAGFEELFFRKYIITEFSKKLSLTKTIRFSALAFALAHLPVEGGLLQYFDGLVLGYLFWITKDWFLCFALHFIHNAVIGLVNEIIFSGVPLLSYNSSLYWVLFFVGSILLWFVIRKLKTEAKKIKT